MAQPRILVVDDEQDILDLVQFNLEKAGYDVTGVTDGSEGVAAARTNPPDLVLLDIMLPGLNGLEVCTLLKNDKVTREASVIMLSAKGEESDVVAGLERGADDYVVKPFSPRVLTARVQAVLRRREQDTPSEEDTIEIHGITIHPGRHEVTVEGEAIQLTYTEFKVLHTMARRPGWVFTRSQIVDRVRGEGYAVTDRAVDVQIVGLRKKLGDHGSIIETVRGVGYRVKG